MNPRFKTFINAAEFEDDQLGLGTDLSLLDVANRAKMPIDEARQHAARMIHEGLAKAIPRQPDHLKLDYDAIEFALQRST